MSTVEDITIESEDRGFELHLIVGDDITHDADGRIVLNIHDVADQLLSEAVTKIGPWMLEGLRVQREMARTPFADDPEREAGETPMDYFKRTGDPEPVLEMADFAHDRERGK